MVGARSATALNFHCGWPEGARTCAVPSPAMTKCFSLVPCGACSVRCASVTLPDTTTSSAPPLERTIKVEPAGTGSGPVAAALPGPVACLLAADRMMGGFLGLRGGNTQG